MESHLKSNFEKYEHKTAAWQNDGLSSKFIRGSSNEVLYKIVLSCCGFRHYAKLQNEKY
jgi:hypothetical protein